MPASVGCFVTVVRLQVACGKAVRAGRCARPRRATGQPWRSARGRPSAVPALVQAFLAIFCLMVALPAGGVAAECRCRTPVAVNRTRMAPIVRSLVTCCRPGAANAHIRNGGYEGRFRLAWTRVAQVVCCCVALVLGASTVAAQARRAPCKMPVDGTVRGDHRLRAADPCDQDELAAPATRTTDYARPPAPRRTGSVLLPSSMRDAGAAAQAGRRRRLLWLEGRPNRKHAISLESADGGAQTRPAAGCEANGVSRARCTEGRLRKLAAEVVGPAAAVAEADAPSARYRGVRTPSAHLAGLRDARHATSWTGRGANHGLSPPATRWPRSAPASPQPHRLTCIGAERARPCSRDGVAHHGGTFWR